MKQVVFAIVIVAQVLIGCSDSNSAAAPDFTCTLDAVLLPTYGTLDRGYVLGHCSKTIHYQEGIFLIAGKSPTISIYDINQEYNSDTHLGSDTVQNFGFVFLYASGLMRNFLPGDTIYFLAYPFNENTNSEYSTAGAHLKWSGLGSPSNVLSVVWK